MTDRTSSATRLIEVFNGAQGLPAGEAREKFLAEACGDDGSLRAEVEQLLNSDDEAQSFLKSHAEALPLSATTMAPFHPERAGEHIGHYTLLQQIGEGGFGTVWMAEQSQPVRRRVALKIIKTGMDTKEVVARFEQERQALAMMDHPGIARVFDAGVTPTGRPYFVMELVRGVKITDYCDEQSLPTEDRVELFIRVCHAVQHAHQKGIIHRDLKPSNILVTINDGEAVPKVIDFGVAKATQGRLTECTLFTQFEQMIGTPLYMSPEQAEMTSLDIDTRSDIYSLGVLLYELLTGRTPIDTASMAKAGMDEIRRIIREVDPPRPSARVKTLHGDDLTQTARRRHTDPARLPGSMRGDIDWIVMKCLEKDRKRRYDTANGLALDLQRHLKNEVIIARPPTTVYLLGKLIKRNKLAFAAAAAVVASLVVGMVMTLWQLAQTRAAEHRAVTALDELRATAPAFAEQARNLAAKERYDEAIEKLDYALKLRPGSVEYLIAKGDLLQCQLKLAEAAAVYREALKIQPGHARAEASAKLCEELLAAKPTEEGTLTRESLGRLHIAMQRQQRPAAELMPVARRLGEEKGILLNYWLERLKDLPISPEKPLKDRLTVRDDGLLSFDFKDTKITDLSPLAGAPVALLVLSGCRELKDISPLHGLDLIGLTLDNTSVADLTPLREMKNLQGLDVSSSHVTDLSPLKELRLKRLSFHGCKVSDISPVRQMGLEEINLRSTRVTDLTPLIDLPIKSIDLSFAPVLDFSPLAKLPLERCIMQSNRITDLSVLRGKSLKELLLWRCVEARNYAVLSEIETLELLQIPSEYRTLPDEDYAAIGKLRHHRRLRQIGSEIMDQMDYKSTGSKEVFWRDWDREQTFVPALRERKVGFSVEKLPSDSYRVSITTDAPVIDLAIFNGAPISELNLAYRKYTDLSPLRGLALRVLNVYGNPVSDLSPLQGMPLEELNLGDTRITDVTALAGMPLKRLYLGSSEGIKDLSSLKSIPSLEYVTVPVGAFDLEPLRALPNLRRLAYRRSDAPPEPMTDTAQFWKEYSQNGWIRKVLTSDPKPSSMMRQSDGTWEIRFASGAEVKDLSALSGAPISLLSVGSTPIADISVLRGLPLKSLSIYYTKVTDLGPLKGMALESLFASGTKVSDISVLRGMPLVDLRLHGCTALTDVSPLAEMKGLRDLTLPDGAQGIEVLRSLPNLKRIGYKEDKDWNPDQKADAFWKLFDSQDWVRRVRDRGITIETPTRLEDGTWSVRCKDPKLTDLSVFRGVAISSLDLFETSVSDVSPLRELPLKTLILNRTKVADLRPLTGLRLEKLDIRETPVTDLAPLRTSPLRESLKSLLIYRINATDYLPIASCVNLERLDANDTGIDNLELVRGHKLRFLRLCRTKVSDISVLAGMPLDLLQIDGTGVTDVRPLLSCPTLAKLVLPQGAMHIGTLRDLPKLSAISYVGLVGGDPKDSAAAFWKEYDKVAWLRALEDADLKPAALQQFGDGTWEVSLKGMTISSLEMLKDAPVSGLQLGRSTVTDLSALRGLPLKNLWIYGTEVSDLSPLQGMKLTTIHLSATPVKDISPLRGMPLVRIRLHSCRNLTDLSPLSESRTLTEITLPPNAKNIEFLRGFPNLKRIGYKEATSTGGPPDKTTAEFWAEYDAKKK